MSEPEFTELAAEKHKSNRPVASLGVTRSVIPCLTRNPHGMPKQVRHDSTVKTVEAQFIASNLLISKFHPKQPTGEPLSEPGFTEFMEFTELFKNHRRGKACLALHLANFISTTQQEVHNEQH